MIVKRTTPMRRVQGARYEMFMGTLVCTRDDKITDFDRTTWSLWGVVLWTRDTGHVDVPMHVFIKDCLG